MSGTIADSFLQKKKTILFLCTYLAVPYIKIKFSESLPSMGRGPKKYQPGFQLLSRTCTSRKYAGTRR